MRVPRDSYLRLLLLLMMVGCALAQEFPGGAVSVRQALKSERGSHPRIVVQTVPGATTTSTCLVIRHSEPGKESPKPGLAHLLEHLQYRTEWEGRPGGLLLRSELLGRENRAYVDAEILVHSETVPSELGFESLQLQLNRLAGVPLDEEGMRSEKLAIGREISKAKQSEEVARRTLLKAYGIEAFVEGTEQNISSFSRADCETLLKSLNLQEDIVISIVGPHTAREVRSHLSKNLKPLAPERTEPRPSRKLSTLQKQSLEAKSPAGFDQDSYFFKQEFKDQRTPRVLEALLNFHLGNSGQAKLEREGPGLYRLDIHPSATSLDSDLRDLSPAESEELFTTLRRQWLDTHESSQTRAKVLAVAELRAEQAAGPVTQQDFSALVAEAKSVLKDLSENGQRLRLKPLDPTKARKGLFPYRLFANREPSVQESEDLPNGLSVTSLSLPSFPITAISGFFRFGSSFHPDLVKELEKKLNAREDLKLQYEIKPEGLLFHYWAPADETVSLLKRAAKELEALSNERDLVAASNSKQSMLESFFLGLRKREKLPTIHGHDILRPSRAHLVVVGDFEEAQLDQGIRPSWSGWFDSEKSRRFFKQSAKAAEGVKLETSKVVELSPKASSVLLLGLRGPARSSQDFLTFNLALQTLAGRPSSSILARKLLKKKSPVASVRLFPLSGSLGALENKQEQIWLIALKLKRPIAEPEKLVADVEKTLREIVDRELPNTELERTRKFLKSRLTLSAASARGRARVLAHAEFYRLSGSYADDFAGLYKNLTPTLVRQICLKYLKNQKVRWLYLKAKKP